MEDLLKKNITKFDEIEDKSKSLEKISKNQDQTKNLDQISTIIKDFDHSTISFKRNLENIQTQITNLKEKIESTQEMTS